MFASTEKGRRAPVASSPSLPRLCKPTIRVAATCMLILAWAMGAAAEQEPDAEAWLYGAICTR